MKPKSEPRTLVRRRKSLWNLLLIVPALAFTGGIWAGLVRLIQQLQSARCPSGTFLFASSQIATIFQVVPIFFASMAFCFLAANWLTHLIGPVGNFFDRDAERHGEPDYRTTQRGVLIFSAAVLAIVLPISIAASLCQYCLLGDEILYQPWPWTGLRHYLWRDVAAIETACRPSRTGSWNVSFFLIMRDGTRIDIMARPRALVHAYPEIVRALQDVDFSFDPRGVRPGCHVPYIELLTRRPQRPVQSGYSGSRGALSAPAARYQWRGFARRSRSAPAERNVDVRHDNNESMPIFHATNRTGI